MVPTLISISFSLGSNSCVHWWLCYNWLSLYTAKNKFWQVKWLRVWVKIQPVYSQLRRPKRFHSFLPWTQGDSDRYSLLQSLCRNHHSGKGREHRHWLSAHSSNPAWKSCNANLSYKNTTTSNKTCNSKVTTTHLIFLLTGAVVSIRQVRAIPSILTWFGRAVINVCLAVHSCPAQYTQTLIVT